MRRCVCPSASAPGRQRVAEFVLTVRIPQPRHPVSVTISVAAPPRGAVWAMRAIGIAASSPAASADTFARILQTASPVELRPAGCGGVHGARHRGGRPRAFTSIFETQRISGRRRRHRLRHRAVDRMRLLEGLDDIGLTLNARDDIAAWEARTVAVRHAAAGGGSPRRRNMNLRADEGTDRAAGMILMRASTCLVDPHRRGGGRGGYAAIGADGAAALASPCAWICGPLRRICDAVSIRSMWMATRLRRRPQYPAMVRMFERAGVAGLFIGDQTFRTAATTARQAVGADRGDADAYQAALDARRDGDLSSAPAPDVMSVEGSMRDRAGQLFLEAGATTPRRRACTPRRVAAWSARSTAVSRDLLQPPVPGTSARRLESAGAAAVSFPSLSLFAAAKAVRDAVTLLRRENSLMRRAPADALPEYYALVGLDQAARARQGYERAAAAVVNKQAAE